MIKHGISEQALLDALPCETIAAGKAGKIFRATGLPHDKNFYKEQGTRAFH